jgi:hypothetical protein
MTWGAIGGAAVGVVGGALLGGGSSGGSSGGSGGSSAASDGIPLSLLAQLVGGGSALNDLFGSGPNSLSGMTQTAANAADPFASQRSGYQGQLAAGTTAAQNIATQTAAGAKTATDPMAVLAGQNTQSAALNSATGGNTVDPNIAALTNPTAAQQFEYQTGLDAATRGAAAGGYVASGRQQLELQNYGQQAASQFLQQDFNNAVTAQGVNNSTQQQNYAQQLGTAQNNQTAQLNQFNELQGVTNTNIAESTLAGNQQNAINQQLLTSSGASTGSPAQAGNILGGEYGNQQTALLSLLESIQGGSGNSLGTLGNGLASGLNGLVNGIGNLFSGDSGASSGNSNGAIFDGTSNSTTVAGQSDEEAQQDALNGEL